MSYEFQPRKLTAITGPSGCGKSTLLYILGLMLKPTQGAVKINSQAISSLSNSAKAEARATQFGFVFQDSQLDPLRTILDSVIEPALYAGWKRDSAVDRAMKLLEMTNVSYRAQHRPREISGGQAQRVALARALVNDPPYILADEPTGNLDHANAKTVLEVFKNQALEGRTVIIVTHDPFVIEHCDLTLELA